jgi:capsular polysaccharide transport system ATP-binding protein
MITLKNLSKYYITPHGRHYVLKDADVHIPHGSKVAVLGLNGAGKSTLLRLLGGVDVPNSGTVTREGKISWPMGLASCLQKSMSGLENARFACRIQGLRADEIAGKLRGIKEFSEIGDYFDMPVKSYSSGMKARLQFAIAMAFDFDCYLIDELSSVGDQAFRSKSEQVFREKRLDASFIKVSHNMGELMRDCDSALLLHQAKLTYFDSMPEAARAYQAVVGRQEKRQVKKQRRSLIRQGVDMEMVETLAPEQVKISPQQRRAQRLARKQEKLRRQQLKAAKVAKATEPKLTREEKKARRKALRKLQRSRMASSPISAQTGRPRGAGSRMHNPAPMAPRLRQRSS